MSNSLPCFHVTTSQGEVYGVAATTKRDAMQMVQDRLTKEHEERAQFMPPNENYSDTPVSASKVATWDVPYGTVLWY